MKEVNMEKVLKDGIILKRYPESIGQMKMDQLFYKGGKADVVDFVDLKNEDQATRACVMALQGLVARELSSSIYIALSDEDDYWAGYCTSEYGAVFQAMTVQGLFCKYRQLVRKLILYNWDNDPQRAFEFNIALMMASLSDGLPVTDEIRDILISYGYDLELEDIRERWGSRMEAYSFAIRELLPQCNKNYVASTGYWQYFNDYVYATKTFCFMLSIRNKEEKSVLDELLSNKEFVRPAIVFGYGQEGDDLLFESAQYGFSYIVSDYFANATFFSSFNMAKEAYRQAVQLPVAAENGKVYIGLYFSDGDNIQFNQRLSSQIWKNKDRGTVPVGMQINPVLFELAPPILHWYYKTLTSNDELVGGPAGFSYVWEDLYLEDCWPLWHAYNNHYLDVAGIRETNTSNILKAPVYADTFTKMSDILGSFVWHSGVYDAETIPYGRPYFFNGVPLVITLIASDADSLYDAIKKCRPADDRPQFVGICLVQAHFGPEAYTMIEQTVKRVKLEKGGAYEFLLPTQTMITVKRWMERDLNPSER